MNDNLLNNQNYIRGIDTEKEAIRIFAFHAFNHDVRARTGILSFF